jgi:rubrerythrin
VLELALRLERLQVAFYGEAIRRGKLTGEARQFARIVGHEEQQHLTYVEHALGRPNAKAARFSFGDATADDKRFVAAAAKIESTGLAAYNGQAGNMSPETLRSAARVISVEARHAAWARSLAGELPAPVPVDVPITAAKALDAIKPYLAGTR